MRLWCIDQTVELRSRFYATLGRSLFQTETDYQLKLSGSFLHKSFLRRCLVDFGSRQLLECGLFWPPL